MNTAIASPILARLEFGFRKVSGELKELEKDLAASLTRSRDFGGKPGTGDEWNARWQDQLDNVDAILGRMVVLTREMDGSISIDENDRIARALEAWEAFLREDAELVERLSLIQKQASGLTGATRTEWNMVAGTLDTILGSIQSCAQSLRIKLELLKKHSAEDVSQLFLNLLDASPRRAAGDTLGEEAYQREYRAAYSQLKQERHTNMGSMDVLKALWMWVETPAERVVKNRSLKVDEE